jgi:hypothetical protein
MIFSAHLKKDNFKKILFVVSVFSFFLRFYVSLHMTGLTDFILAPPIELDSGVYLRFSNDILSGNFNGGFIFNLSIMLFFFLL